MRQCLCILAKWYAWNIFCCLFDTFECSSSDWTQLLIILGRMRKQRRWIISVSSCPINRSGRPWSPCWKGTRSWWWPTTLATSHPQAQFLISYIIILYTISAGTMTRTFSFSKEGIEEVNIYLTSDYIFDENKGLSLIRRPSILWNKTCDVKESTKEIKLKFILSVAL